METAKTSQPSTSLGQQRQYHSTAMIRGSSTIFDGRDTTVHMSQRCAVANIEGQPSNQHLCPGTTVADAADELINYCLCSAELSVVSSLSTDGICSRNAYEVMLANNHLKLPSGWH